MSIDTHSTVDTQTTHESWTIHESQTIDGTGEPVDTATSLVEDELLVEEVSIDGMCGVY